MIISLGLRACNRNFYIYIAVRNVCGEVFLQGKALKCMYALLIHFTSDHPFEVHFKNMYNSTTIFIATVVKIGILVGVFVFWRGPFLYWKYLETIKNDDEYKTF